MVVEVIGAGLGRTGTSSFCDALDILGYRCHHMKRFFEDSTGESSKLFYRACQNKKETDWDKVYEGYTAAADFTGAYFYKELLAANPDAKVVLTVRPFKDWYESMKKTIYRAVREGKDLKPGDRHYEFKQISRIVVLDGHIMDDTKFNDADFMEIYYNNHTEEVKRVVPEGQLLVFNLGDGWENLCKFLCKDVPTSAYPNLNSTSHFEKRFQVKITAKAFTADQIPNLSVGK